MSWKSFITAGLLCILASPAFGAAAPQLEIISDGLDTNGNFIWYVRVAPSDAARTNASGPSTGSPMAVELGLRTNTGHQLFTPTSSPATPAVANINATVWDTDTPGKTIFGWETKYQIIDPNTLLPTGTLAGEGIEAFCATGGGGCTLSNGATRPTGAGNNHPITNDVTADGFPPVNGTGSELFVALGSDVQSNANTTTAYAITMPAMFPAGANISNATAIAQGTQFLRIITKGPTDTSLQGSLTLLGSHGTGLNEGRIAEITTGTQGTNYKGFTGAAQITVGLADTDLSGWVDVSDLSTFGLNFDGGHVNPNNKNWTLGDFNGDGFVDVSDLSTLGLNFNGGHVGSPVGSYTKLAVTGVNDPASGAPLGGDGLSATGVPEPASVALLGLALLGGLGLMRRRA